ncbi:MAG: terminase family protein, partial [Patescibacteria group bacterium]|nr:terminase family protein [Patescibacteria group bacterium]
MPRKKKNILWSPQPKQVLALERPEFEILYGGARGGGKTDAGIMWMAFSYDENGNPVYQNPMYRGLVIRLNAKDLGDWIERAKFRYRTTGAEFTGVPTQIRFPSGAIIRTGHLNDEDAYNQYLGHEYQQMNIEELTQIPSEVSYTKLISSCRSTVPELRPQVFCTTNPGNVGHDWVKKRWRIPDVVTDNVIITPTEFGNRAFIHATVYDNEILDKNDPNYRKQLEAIPDENLRRAWLMGEWGNPIIPGSIYKDEIDKAERNGQIGLYRHNPAYPVHTYWDIGVGDATAIGFFQFIKGTWFWIDYLEDSG